MVAVTVPMGDLPRQWIWWGTEIGTLINKQGSYALLVPTPIISSILWKGTSFNPKHFVFWLISLAQYISLSCHWLKFPFFQFFFQCCDLCRVCGLGIQLGYIWIIGSFLLSPGLRFFWAVVWYVSLLFVAEAEYCLHHIGLIFGCWVCLGCHHCHQIVINRNGWCVHGWGFVGSVDGVVQLYGKFGPGGEVGKFFLGY